MRRLILLAVLALLAFYVAWPAYTGYRIHQGLEGRQPEVLAARIDFPSVRRSMREPVLQHVTERIESVMRDLGPATRLLGYRIPQDNIEKIIDGALETVVSPEKIVEVHASTGTIRTAIQDAVLDEINKMGGLMSVLKLDKLLVASKGEGKEGDKDISIGGFKIRGLGKYLGNKNVNEALGKMIGKYAFHPGKPADNLFARQRNGSAASGAARDGTKDDTSKRRTFGIGNIKSLGFAGPLALTVGVARSADADVADLTAEMTFKNYDWRITKMTPNLLGR